MMILSPAQSDVHGRHGSGVGRGRWGAAGNAAAVQRVLSPQDPQLLPQLADLAPAIPQPPDPRKCGRMQNRYVTVIAASSSNPAPHTDISDLAE